MQNFNRVQNCLLLPLQTKNQNAHKNHCKSSNKRYHYRLKKLFTLTLYSNSSSVAAFTCTAFLFCKTFFRGLNGSLCMEDLFLASIFVKVLSGYVNISILENSCSDITYFQKLKRHKLLSYLLNRDHKFSTYIYS